LLVRFLRRLHDRQARSFVAIEILGVASETVRR
jgi:hypothetical protein